MRNAARAAGLLALATTALASAACGAGSSNASVTAVQDNHYTCKGDRVFEAAVQAVEKEFGATKSRDPGQGSIIGETVWFDDKGSPRAVADLAGGEIAVVARVQINDLKPNYKIIVDGIVKQRVGDDPEPRDLSGPRPAWVQKKLDNVTLEAHRLLESCAMLTRDPR